MGTHRRLPSPVLQIREGFLEERTPKKLEVKCELSRW